jgi:hypothetical protein
MPASFVLTLDTTGPQNVAVSIDGGAALSIDHDVALAITTTDPDTSGYQAKVWGDVAGVPDEATATWQTLTPSIAATLTAGDGAKTVFVRLRDDVWNESATATASIAVDSTAPVVTILAGPAPQKISKVTGKDVSTVTWSSDSDFDEFTVRVVPDVNSDHTAGTEIPTAGGSTDTSGGAGTAADPMTTTIDGTDLEAAAGADGDWTIKVFVREAASGYWSV